MRTILRISMLFYVVCRRAALLDSRLPVYPCSLRSGCFLARAWNGTAQLVPVPPALRTQASVASDPCTFNDPFEVRPYFDQDRHDYSAQGHEVFHRAASGVEHSLVKNQSLVGFPVENVVGFGGSTESQISRRDRSACGSSRSWRVC